MNSRVEAIVRRLFSDGEFREAAIKDARVALEQYELSEVERRALTRLCAGLTQVGRPSAPGQVTPLSWM